MLRLRLWRSCIPGRWLIPSRWGVCKVLALLLIMTIGLGANVQAQQGTSAYGLREIVGDVAEHSGPYWDSLISIVSVEANTGGGEIQLRVQYSKTCNELYRFQWTFDRDVTQWRPGESVAVIGTGEVLQSSCQEEHNAFMVISGLDGILPSPLIEGIQPLGSHDTEGRTERIYAREEGDLRSRGSAELRLIEHASQEYVAFQLYVAAGTPYSFDPSTVYGPPEAQSVRYDVVYLYQANWQGEPRIISPDTPSGEPAGAPGEQPVDGVSGAETDDTGMGTDSAGEGATDSVGGADAGGTEAGGTEAGGVDTSPVPGSDSTPPPFDTAEPAAVARMTLQAGQRRVVAGDVVYVPVWLINGVNVANINFTVGYDAGIAMPEGDLLRGNLLDNALFSSNSGERDLIQVGFARTRGVNGTGTVAYMPFRAVGQPGERTVLDVSVSMINDPDGTVLTIDRVDGAILIVDQDGMVPGDCDGDGVLTEVDALCALQMSVKLIPARAGLDVDADNQVTSRDSVVILQRAIGK